MKNYNIIHLSDLHLTRSDGRARAELDLFDPLRGMNRNFREILHSNIVSNSDLVIITGDITDRGDYGSWKIFWHAIYSAGIRKKLILIPGNHDILCLGWRLPLVRKRKYYSKQDLDKLIRGLKLGNMHYKGYPWVKTWDDYLAVFGVNSNNMGNSNIVSNAMGSIGYYQLEKLARLLREYKNFPVKLVLMHHSPNIPKITTARKRNQKEFNRLDKLTHKIPQGQRRALRLLCVTHSVKAILHGHLHLNEDRRVNGLRIIGVKASTEPNKFNELQFNHYKLFGDSKVLQRNKRSLQI